MKKKFLLMTAAALCLAQSVPAFANNSPDTDIVIGDRVDDDGKDIWDNSSSSGGGSGSATGNTSTSASGGPAAAQDQVQLTNSQGVRTSATSVQDTNVSIVVGDAATAGLPSNIVSEINQINAGAVLNTIITDVDLNGYNTLTTTNALVTTDSTTNAVKTGTVQVPVYVPNLTDGLGTIEVLFYDNATGRWTLIPVSSIDIANKTIYVNFTGSGTFSVVYKK